MFKLTFKTQNAAFDAGPPEIARILRQVAENIERDYSEGTVRDINGNTVGAFKLT